MTELTFRLFKDDDLELYLRWVNQKAIWEVDNSGPYEFRTPELFHDKWKEILAANHSYMIIKDDREIGYIGLFYEENLGLTSEFFIVIGETDEWGKGHGKVAMDWLVQHAKQNDLSQLLATVLGNNERAQKFYRSLGFKWIKEKEDPYERNGKSYRLQEYVLTF